MLAAMTENPYKSPEGERVVTRRLLRTSGMFAIVGIWLLAFAMFLVGLYVADIRGLRFSVVMIAGWAFVLMLTSPIVFARIAVQVWRKWTR